MHCSIYRCTLILRSAEFMQPVLPHLWRPSPCLLWGCTELGGDVRQCQRWCSTCEWRLWLRWQHIEQEGMGPWVDVGMLRPALYAGSEDGCKGHCYTWHERTQTSVYTKATTSDLYDLTALVYSLRSWDGRRSCWDKWWCWFWYQAGNMGINILTHTYTHACTHTHNTGHQPVSNLFIHLTFS